MDIETPNALKSKRSRMISTVLSPALRLWLRSQVEQVDALQFKITGGDRQILTGYIPSISIAASHAIYQGLHLSQIQLEGSNIRVNLGQVIKGKPLHLLEPVPVVGQLLLLESDLQASLQSPLLSTALTELLDRLLQSDQVTKPYKDLKDKKISWQQIVIDTNQLTLVGTLTEMNLQTTPIELRASLQLAMKSVLQLNSLQIQLKPESEPINLDNFQVDLGSEVELQELTLTPGQLRCNGRLTVMP